MNTLPITGTKPHALSIQFLDRTVAEEFSSPVPVYHLVAAYLDRAVAFYDLPMQIDVSYSGEFAFVWKRTDYDPHSWGDMQPWVLENLGFRLGGVVAVYREL